MPVDQNASIGTYWQQASLADVLGRIHAPEAWSLSTGLGVTLALIDSGVNGNCREFPDWKRAGAGISNAYQDGAWVDGRGHGTMAACIAAATDAAHGRYKGVAPEAKIFPCRTCFKVNDALKIFDQIHGMLVSGALALPMVINCSFGFERCTSPEEKTFSSRHRLITLVRSLVQKGVVIVCAAGNNHLQSCGFDPEADKPNTIWGINSLDEVISVGAVDWNNENTRGIYSKSSRGCGQFAQNTSKPDCVAPSYGEVSWGGVPLKMQWWGTSGAAPQVAGLAALVLSRTKGALQSHEIKQVIVQNCKSLGTASRRVGAGLIHCYDTLKSL